jgi:hypothetical protein
MEFNLRLIETFGESNVTKYLETLLILIDSNLQIEKNDFMKESAIKVNTFKKRSKKNGGRLRVNI